MLGRGPRYFMLLATITLNLEIDPSPKPITEAHRNRDLFNYRNRDLAPGKYAKPPMTEGFKFLSF